MALSDIAICNMALGHLGRTVAPIASFNEKSVEARLCSTWYDQCRREVLEAQDWGFARGRVALALHSDPPPIEWVYRYQTPSDMIAVRRLSNPYEAIDHGFFGHSPSYEFANFSDALGYQLETSVDGQSLTLLTNKPKAHLIYTRDQTLVQMFSALFVNALSHYLAAKIAYAVTAKPQNEQKETQAFQVAMRAAAGSDANQGQPGPIRDAASIRARA